MAASEEPSEKCPLLLCAPRLSGGRPPLPSAINLHCPCNTRASAEMLLPVAGRSRTEKADRGDAKRDRFFFFFCFLSFFCTFLSSFFAISCFVLSNFLSSVRCRQLFRRTRDLKVREGCRTRVYEYCFKSNGAVSNLASTLRKRGPVCRCFP